MPKYIIKTSQDFYHIVETGNDDMDEVAELFVAGDIKADLVTATQIDVDICELHEPDSFENLIGEMGGLDEC